LFISARLWPAAPSNCFALLSESRKLQRQDGPEPDRMDAVVAQIVTRLGTQKDGQTIAVQHQPSHDRMPALLPAEGWHQRPMPNNPFKAAASSSVEAIAAPVGNRSEFDSVFAAQVHEPNAGLIVMPDSFLVARRVEITSLAARYRLPVVYRYALFAEVGGLLISTTKIAALSALMTPAYCCRSFSGC
jgi:hypothetical protein